MRVQATRRERHGKAGEMRTTEVTREWVGYPEAERYCGLSHTTLWRYVTSGEIKAARVGRSVRIHLPSLMLFMEERAAEKGSEATTISDLA